MGNAIVNRFFQITGKHFESSGNNLEQMHLRIKQEKLQSIPNYNPQVSAPLFWRHSFASPLLVVLPQLDHPYHYQGLKKCIF